MEKVPKVTIYLAGPLFDIADQVHNLHFAQALRRLGYRIILPQIEAAKFFDGQRYDLKGIAKSCRTGVMFSDIVVANIDGPDTDSGTALEVGLAIQTTVLFPAANKPKVVCVRTDVRTSPKQELGINAMFLLASRIIYLPASIKSLKEARDFYKNLATEIDKEIKGLSIES